MLAETIELWENWLVAGAGLTLVLSLIIQYRILRAVQKTHNTFDREYIVRVAASNKRK